MNILVINGPNINLLGIRETEIYGDKTYHELVKELKYYANQKSCKIKIYQSNHEGNIIDLIHKKYKKYDALILNPGAFTHYAYSIRDCILATKLFTVEVHLSDITKREAFRKYSIIEDIVNNRFMGKGIESYKEAIDYILKVKK